MEITSCVNTANRQHASPARWHVLLTEDNPIYQRMAVKILEAQGHSVTIANNGSEALAALERETFTIVLMDLEMPVMDGLEATQAIRARERQTGRRIPILAVTSCSTEADRRRCLAAGMDDLLAKPAQPRALLEAIRALVESAPVEPSLDAVALLQRLDGDQDLLREITQMFLEEAPKLMHEIETSIAEADPGKLKLAAHTLRGSLANFSAESAQRAAQTLEMMGRTGNLAGAAAASTTLDTALRRLQPALYQLLELEPLNSETSP